MNISREQMRSLINGKNFIVLNKDIVKRIGLHEALLISHLAYRERYWEERGMINENGFFYSTQEDIEEETTLSPHQQRKAFSKLAGLGIVEIRKMGMPAKNYYKLHYSQLLNFLTTSDKKNEEQVVKNFNTNLINNNLINNNNNPPAEDGGNNTRPEAGVVVGLTDSLQKKQEREEAGEAGAVIQESLESPEREVEELVEKYSRLTGRRKESLIRKLVSQYGAERVRKGIEYLEEMLQRTSVSRPEGFLVKLLMERWNIEKFDRRKLETERRIEREKQKLEELKRSMSSRADPETGEKYIEQIREILGVKKCENTDVLECGRRCGENDPGSSLGPGSEGEGKGRPG